ncbi:MAG: Uma2 family endonuclease [Gammaproteobacteria bacterium]|nr:Uma2 family endonuclease [Gammaproteobacteria bacterium]
MNTVMREDDISRHRITVDEYYRMAEVGLLAPDARVELIDGEIIDMAPIGSRHGGTETQLLELLYAAVGARAMVRSKLPVRLSNWSEPQPDVSVVKRRQDYYKTAHPTAEDVVLIVEVSDTSLHHDLTVKASLYARHGIPEVWIIDLDAEQIHFFRSPSGETYTEVSADKTPGLVTLAMLPDVTVDLTGIFLTG